MWMQNFRRLSFTERWAVVSNAVQRVLPKCPEALHIEREFGAPRRPDKATNTLGQINATMIRPEVASSLRTWFSWLTPTGPAVQRRTFVHWHVCVYDAFLFRGMLTSDRSRRAAEDVADEDWVRLVDNTDRTLGLDEFIKVSLTVLAFWIETPTLTEVMELLNRVQSVIFRANVLVHPYMNTGLPSTSSLKVPSSAKLKDQHEEEDDTEPRESRARAATPAAYLDEISEQLRADVIHTTTLWQRQHRYIDFKRVTRAAVPLSEYNKRAYGHSLQDSLKAYRSGRNGEKTSMQKCGVESVVLDHMTRRLQRGETLHGNRTTSLIAHLQRCPQDAVNLARAEPSSVQRFAAALDQAKTSAAVHFRGDTRDPALLDLMRSMEESLTVESDKLPPPQLATRPSNGRAVYSPPPSRTVRSSAFLSSKGPGVRGLSLGVHSARQMAASLDNAPEAHYRLPPSRILRPLSAPLSTFSKVPRNLM